MTLSFWLFFSDKRCGGTEPIIPCRGSVPQTSTDWPYNTRGSIPPTVTTLMKPSSSTCCTMSPTSSMWASMSSLGPSPGTLAMRLPIASVLTSAVSPPRISSTISLTAPSLPEMPGARVKRFKRLISILFIHLLSAENRQN